MGLFGLFGKNAGKAPAPVEPKEESSGLEHYAGMRVEVTSPDGQLLFVAKLLGLQGTQAELHQTTASSISREMEEPLAVQIRGYSDRDSKAVYLEGRISPAADSQIWAVENLTLVKLGNDRAFFRMDIDVDAGITPVGRIGAAEEPCKLLNISVGGIRISSLKQHFSGEKFLLNVTLSPENGPSIMLCQILRVIEREDGYEYGCCFTELHESDQDKIMQIIFNLQRKKSGRS